MPHLSIEFTDNLTSRLDVDACLRDANAALAASGHFSEADIKSRAYPAAAFRVGVEAKGRAFIAARLSVLSGRSAQIKHDLAQLLLHAIGPNVPASSDLSVQLSVEIVDIERSTYAKRVLPANAVEIAAH